MISTAYRVKVVFQEPTFLQCDTFYEWQHANTKTEWLLNNYVLLNRIFGTCPGLSNLHNIDNLEGLRDYTRTLDNTKTQYLLRTELASAYTYISSYYKQCMGLYNILIVYIPPPKLHWRGLTCQNTNYCVGCFQMKGR